MGKPLSMDLRSRALAAVDEGVSCRAAARRFGVAAASAVEYPRRLPQLHLTELRYGRKSAIA